MAVLPHGIGLQSIKRTTLFGFDLDNVLFIVFSNALESSGCAKRMVALSLEACNVDVDGVRALADLLCRDAFPVLEVLRFDDCVCVCVVLLSWPALSGKHDGHV